MAELFEQDIRTNHRQSSKGNQLKWENNGMWYKADYTGYEGLVEYMISHLLQKSSLSDSEFVLYELEEIKYKTVKYNGVRSKNFLEQGEFTYCPIFDNGAGLLADTAMDYPLEGDVIELMKEVQAKTICSDFDEQLNASEALYKGNLHFSFTKTDVQELLKHAEQYSPEVRNRVEELLYAQMRKYQYLFR